MSLNDPRSSGLSSSDYEAEANRLRAEMGLTIDALRSNLTPQNLASEAASQVGMSDLSLSSALDVAGNRLAAEAASRIGVADLSLSSVLDAAGKRLAAEAASRMGVEELSWSSALDYAGKRHPVPTAIIGLGLALWTLSAFRGRARRETLASLGSPLAQSSSSLVDSATRVLRDRAEAKRQEFIGTAQARVVSGAEHLSDEIERRVENIIVGVPGGNQARPLIASAIQIGLAALLENLLHKRSR
jgi:hypothetical protein